MNLADAIRRAATVAGNKPMEQPEIFAAAPTIEPDWEPQVFEPPTDSEHAAAEPQSPEVEAIEVGASIPAQAPAGGMVRVEVFLPSDQLTGFFRAVAATQHPILTLREASSFLRVSATTLEDLAGKGKVPAFKVDGRWRFAKTSLEEWIAERHREAKESRNVA
ncbi:MAG: helix-turn-helix domain-containing protein [Fimbriimonadaceae bacterium]|nr:helix-turn-helix domain-containing protein [Fimbriimonadaceae bacterium]